MIYGIGVDIIEIGRVEKALQRFGNRFLQKILTSQEMKKTDIKEVAVRFAAKEALVKALGTGFRGVGFKDIEILNDERGKPYYRLSERVYDRFGKLSCHLSLSHERDYAVAMAVVERL